MSILCSLFGHKIGGGYTKRFGDEYFRVTVQSTDGIGRVHCALHTRCERCEKIFRVGRIHLPLVDDATAELLKKSNAEREFAAKYNTLAATEPKP